MTDATAYERLDGAAIEAALESLPGWVRAGDELQRTFACGDFLGSLAFCNKLAQPAEAAGHHPDLLVRYGKVTVHLTTHDAGGITAKDIDMAAAIDGLDH